MITLRTATTSDLKIVREIAYKSWPQAYGQILSKAQIEFMLDSFYAIPVLKLNIQERQHHFLLVYEDIACLGFASYEHKYQNQAVTRLHKLYLLPEAKGKGAGKALILSIEKLAKENASQIISLNVNKFNPSVGFYKKLGFTIVAEEDLEIGQGYLMEDYKMEKQL